VVLDLPGGKFDENTAITNTGKDSKFAQLFGATLDNYQFSGSNKTISLKGKEWTGFVVDMTPQEANTLEYYRHW
jgi:beta-galactosidase